MLNKSFIFIYFLSLTLKAHSAEIPLRFLEVDPKRITDISSVQIGMTLQEVTVALKRDIEVGYHKDEASQSIHKVILNTLYRLEVLEKHGRRYDVAYFWTSLVKSDGLISEEELTPLIFQNGKFIARGQDFLFKLKNQMN